jgi:hypothetical protein
MSQHFLLTAAAKTLSLTSVAHMSDEEAETVFHKIRWASKQRRSIPPALRLCNRLRLPPC